LNPDIILTFDDGLYSNWWYFKKLNNIFNGPKIFLVNADIVLSANELKEHKLKVDIECTEAHENYFRNNDASAYMQMIHLKAISQYQNCFIGWHTNNHTDLTFPDENISLKDKIIFFKEDIQKAKEFFETLELPLKHFQFPYNKEDQIYLSLLKKEINSNIIYYPSRIELK